MGPADLSPLAAEDQTSSPIDLFLIFVGANVVATTLQVGASLPASYSWATALVVIGVGSVAGAMLTAVLAPLGSRLRIPSIVATRAALGYSGGQALATLLFITNFAWIALNNVIAASITARVTGVGSTELWAVGLGILATLIVLGGPRLAAVVDRVAVPLLLLAGGVFTYACLRTPWPAWPESPTPAGDIAVGLDMVIGYQASWLLMFADYPRFVRSPRGAGSAVLAGLALTSLWFMPLGFFAAGVAGSSDPGAMISSLNLGAWGALLVAVAALTTNFVNVYMSALALRSLRPSIPGTTGVWIIGGIGAALGAFSMEWLERYGEFTLFLGSALVPIGGILLAHFFVLRAPVDVPQLYVVPRLRDGWSVPGLLAWIVGGVVFHLAGSIGGTLPCLVSSMLVYLLANRVARR
jgi:NCS1 family nucleobase:cation symporter-1